MARTTRATQALAQAGVAFTVHAYAYDPEADRIGLAAADLDVATCQWIQKSVEYKPGTDFNGNPILSYVVVPMNWFPDCLGVDCGRASDP